MRTENLGLDGIARCGTVIKAIKSGGWWTPEEIAVKTVDLLLGEIDDAITDLRERGFLDRRHLGSNKRGDMFAYRLRAPEATGELSAA